MFAGICVMSACQLIPERYRRTSKRLDASAINVTILGNVLSTYGVVSSTPHLSFSFFRNDCSVVRLVGYKL